MSDKAWLVRHESRNYDYRISWGEKPFIHKSGGWAYEELASHVNAALWEDVRSDLKLEPGGGPVEVKPLDWIHPEIFMAVRKQRNDLLAAAKKAEWAIALCIADDDSDSLAADVDDAHTALVEAIMDCKEKT